MKFIFLILISIGFTFPPSFNLDRNAEIVNNGLPDNGIIDIEAISNNQLYFGTSSGLGRVDINGEELIFSTVMSETMPEGGKSCTCHRGKCNRCFRCNHILFCGHRV